MTVRRLVWDMDGTLLDSSVVVPAAWGHQYQSTEPADVMLAAPAEALALLLRRW